MIGIGIGLSTRFINIEAAAAIEDFFFELSSGDIQPLDSITDYNSIWELDGDGNIMPEDAPADEGFFQLDGNGDIMPIE